MIDLEISLVEVCEATRIMKIKIKIVISEDIFFEVVISDSDEIIVRISPRGSMYVYPL